MRLEEKSKAKGIIKKYEKDILKKMYVEPMYFFNKYWEGVNWEKLEKVTSLLEEKIIIFSRIT